ncbi:YqzL family protein [Tumebacillus permanentifrigoris]|nr:YqzL family protein [Tumebacillus permanentifrigoris]
MRDFSWRYFESTGEIDAYLLYKEHQTICNSCSSSEDAEPVLNHSEGEPVAE